MLHRREPKQINFRHPDIQLIVKEDDVTMIIIVFTKIGAVYFDVQMRNVNRELGDAKL